MWDEVRHKGLPIDLLSRPDTPDMYASHVCCLA